MSRASRALVERLAGHPGIGESSRTANLTVVAAPKPVWAVAHAQDLGDGCFALTLVRDARVLDDGDEADATAICSWHRFGPRDVDLVVDQCTDLSAERWLAGDGNGAAIDAVKRAR